jgi:hypothetical protein
VSRWQTTHFMFPKLPRKAGVYVIYVQGKPVYVGSSTDLFARVRSYELRHGYGRRNVHTPWGSIDEAGECFVKFKESQRLGDWAMDEIRLIARLSPVFNKQHVRRRAA